MWDAASLRVANPRDIVFLCGGPYSDPPSDVLSKRDLLLRLSRNGELSKFKFILAESVKEFGERANYKDILTFESDIAQISATVLIFTESEGSFTELGAFSMINDITERLLVVIDDYYYNKNSFIKWGPIEYLENNEGEGSVYVLNREAVGMGYDGRITDIDHEIFGTMMLDAIKVRIKSARGSTRFDPSRTGHIIRFLTGLLQDYGALTADEMLLCAQVNGLDVSLERILAFMDSAELLTWVVKRRDGTSTYFAATDGREAIRYELKEGAAYLDRSRWRTDVISHWAETEPARMRAIEVARAAR